MISQEYILLIFNCVNYRYKALRQQETWLKELPGLQNKLVYYHVLGDPNLPNDYLFDEDPTFIIIDIEGYERQALSGMKKLIRRSTPAIAIAVYHFPSDILKIPKLVMEIAPYKNVVLRNYSGCVVDTVMYFYD